MRNKLKCATLTKNWKLMNNKNKIHPFIQIRILLFFLLNGKNKLTKCKFFWISNRNQWNSQNWWVNSGIFIRLLWDQAIQSLLEGIRLSELLNFALDIKRQKGKFWSWSAIFFSFLFFLFLHKNFYNFIILDLKSIAKPNVWNRKFIQLKNCNRN